VRLVCAAVRAGVDALGHDRVHVHLTAGLLFIAAIAAVHEGLRAAGGAIAMVVADGGEWPQLAGEVLRLSLSLHERGVGGLLVELELHAVHGVEVGRIAQDLVALVVALALERVEAVGHRGQSWIEIHLRLMVARN